MHDSILNTNGVLCPPARHELLWGFFFSQDLSTRARSWSACSFPKHTVFILCSFENLIWGFSLPNAL